MIALIRVFKQPGSLGNCVGLTAERMISCTGSPTPASGNLWPGASSQIQTSCEAAVHQLPNLPVLNQHRRGHPGLAWCEALPTTASLRSSLGGICWIQALLPASTALGKAWSNDAPLMEQCRSTDGAMPEGGQAAGPPSCPLIRRRRAGGCSPSTRSQPSDCST